MKVYLASLFHNHYYQEGVKTYVLDSFYYHEPEFDKYTHLTKDFILDSGAFSFMNGQDKPDFLSYTDLYIDYINTQKIEKFMELDIDCIKSLDYVEMLRKRIESRTGRQTIPVWHKSRGLDYFKGLCRDYEYVAIGGLVTKEIKPKQTDKLKLLIDYAHSQGTKIHGLGFAIIRKLSYLHWDSIDTTYWQSGGRYGQLHFFDREKGQIKQARKPANKRANYKAVNKHNVEEWIKFQRWADMNL